LCCCGCFVPAATALLLLPLLLSLLLGCSSWAHAALLEPLEQLGSNLRQQHIDTETDSMTNSAAADVDRLNAEATGVLRRLRTHALLLSDDQSEKAVTRPNRLRQHSLMS
jgi:hypothetical protein